jgi:hypothetical protein
MVSPGASVPITTVTVPVDCVMGDAGTLAMIHDAIPDTADSMVIGPAPNVATCPLSGGRTYFD